MSTQQALGRWISVKPCNYVTSDDSVDIRILTSPYDIPDWLRSGYDDDLDRFVVEFRYMVDEEYRILNVGNGAEVEALRLCGSESGNGVTEGGYVQWAGRDSHAPTGMLLGEWRVWPVYDTAEYVFTPSATILKVEGAHMLRFDGRSR